jgi:hypothetical protein
MYDLIDFGIRLNGFGMMELSTLGVMYSERPIEVVERYEYQLDCLFTFGGGSSWDFTSCKYRSRARVDSWDVVSMCRSGMRYAVVIARDIAIHP